MDDMVKKEALEGSPIPSIFTVSFLKSVWYCTGISSGIGCASFVVALLNSSALTSLIVAIKLWNSKS